MDSSSDHISSKAIRAFVFAEGFLVLSLQILVSVALVPYWGQTYTFWLYSLLCSMTGLSLGYLFTPKLIQRTGNPLRFLRLTSIFLVVYCSVFYAFYQVILRSLLNVVDDPASGMWISLILFFFIPTVLFGTIPMTLVQLSSQEKDVEGQASGKVFSMSSMGGIAGVVVVSYVLLPFGSIELVICIELLMLLVLFLWIARLTAMKNSKWLVVAVAGISVLILFSNKKQSIDQWRPDVRVVAEENGVLGHLLVLDNTQNQTRYLMVNHNIQSQAHFSGRSLNPYIYSLSMYASYLPAQSSVLIAGLGCGSLAYEYGELGYDVDVVDIDDRLDGLVQEHFLKSRNAYHFIHSDARRYVKTSSKKYAAIVLDLSHGESIPTNVYTVEGFREVGERLEKDGILLIHFLAAQSDEGKLALSSVLTTLESAGFDVEIMNFLNRDRLFGDPAWEGKPEGFVIAAQKGQVKLHEQKFKVDPSLLAELYPNYDSLYLNFVDRPKGVLLTDDSPVLDQFHAKTALLYRQLSIAQLKSMMKNE